MSKVGLTISSADVLPAVQNLTDSTGKNIWQTASENLVAAYQPTINQLNDDLYKAQKTYERSATPVTNYYERSLVDLRKDYSEAISAAYDAYEKNKRATYFGSLGTGDQETFNAAYSKALEKQKQEYYDKYLQNADAITKNYKSQLNTLYKDYESAEKYYQDTIQDILSEMSKQNDTWLNQQTEIAENSADILNSIYEYVNEVLSIDPDDETLFGPTSPLYKMFYSDGTFINEDEFLNKFTVENKETGKRELSPEYYQLIKFINNLEQLREKDDSGYERYKYEGFSDYLLRKNKNLATWYTKNKDVLWNVLGIDNPYEYNPVEYAEYTKATSPDVSTDEIGTGETISELLSDILNKLNTDNKDLLMYKGDLYKRENGTWTKASDVDTARTKLANGETLRVDGNTLSMAQSNFGVGGDAVDPLISDMLNKLNTDNKDSLEFQGKLYKRENGTWISPVDSGNVGKSNAVLDRYKPQTFMVDGTNYKVNMKLPKETISKLEKVNGSALGNVINMDGRYYVRLRWYSYWYGSTSHYGPRPSSGKDIKPTYTEHTDWFELTDYKAKEATK